MLRADRRVLSFVEADGEKLRQVLINLIGNAVKYTERGSVILRVGGQRVEDSQDCRLVMEVQDTGIGIAKRRSSPHFRAVCTGGQAVEPEGHGTGAGHHQEVRRADGRDHPGRERAGQRVLVSGGDSGADS